MPYLASEALIYDTFLPVELCQSSDHMSKLGLYESVKAVIVCQSSKCISKQKLNSLKICGKFGGPILGVKAV